MFAQMQACGSVEHDPELKVIKDGIPITEFSLAVTTKRCVEDITIWLSCYAWGDQAENIKRSVRKGARLLVQGDFTSYPFTTEDGKQEVTLEVNVKEFSLEDQ
jgi:single-strand DNA-binding protein